MDIDVLSLVSIYRARAKLELFSAKLRRELDSQRQCARHLVEAVRQNRTPIA